MHPVHGPLPGRIRERSLQRYATGGGSAADQQREFEVLPFHLPGYVHHFVEGRCDQPAQANNIDFFSFGGLQDLIGWHHYPKVDDVIAVTTQYDAYDVLSNIMYIPFYCGEQDPGGACAFFIDGAGGFVREPAFFFFRPRYRE